MIFRRNKSKRKKISEMVMDFAGDYIAMGEDIEDKQQYLNSAVSAWNIACLDEKDRKRSIKKYMAEYRKLNPAQSKQDFRDVEDELRLLIKQKEKLYPEVRVQIVDAHIKEVNGKNHVTVASLTIK
jgi:glycerol-3-phosphate cytidylyltransferase-like family protein